MEKEEIIIHDILEGAKQLFSKYGLKKTTMDEIAKAAGKGKSTLYYYFPSKNEIFEAVVEDEMKNLIKKVRNAINNPTTAKKKMKAFLGTNLSSIIGCQNLSLVLKEDICNNMLQLLKIKQKYEQMQINMMKEIILGGVQSGEFRELGPEMIEKFSFALVASFRGLSSPLSISLSDFKYEEYFDVLVDIFIEGIGKKIQTGIGKEDLNEKTL